MQPRIAPSKMLLVLSGALACGLGLLVATERGLLDDLWKSLADFRAASLAAAFLLVLAQIGLQSLRFWSVVGREARLTVLEAAYVFTLGDWANLFAPARAGEALKVVLMRRAEAGAGIDVAKATGAVVADRIVDAAALLLLCAAAGALDVFRGALGEASSSPVFRVNAAALAALLLVAVAIVLARPAWAAKLKDVSRRLLEGAATLKDPGRCSASLGLGLGAWAAELLALRVLCAGLGFSPSLAQLAFAIAILNVGMAVPITVASLGVYEAALAYALSRSGLPLPSAIAIAAAHHVVELFGIGVSAAAFSLPVHLRRRGTRKLVPGGHDAGQAPLSCGLQPGLPKGPG